MTQSEKTETEIAWIKVEQMVRRECNRRFLREFGRLGSANIFSFTMEMVARAHPAPDAAKQGPADKQLSL